MFRSAPADGVVAPDQPPEGVDNGGGTGYLDKVGSVSGLEVIPEIGLAKEYEQVSFLPEEKDDLPF